MTGLDSQELCLLGFPHGWLTCMQKSEWASWFQALGAFIAIGAAFFVMRWQLREQARLTGLEQQSKAKADEIAALDRALLLLDWYANAAREFASLFNPRLPVPWRTPFWLSGSAVSMPGHLEPMSVSFLVQRDAQRIHTSIEVIALTFAAFESAAIARAELMTSDVVRQRLFAEHEKIGRLPLPDTWQRIFGAPLLSQIVNATEILAERSADAYATIEREAALIRTELARVYPGVTFAQR